MRADERVGPQGTIPGRTDDTDNHQIAATSEYIGGNGQSATAVSSHSAANGQHASVNGRGASADGGRPQTGYASAYPLYDERGWPNTLKLPRGKKWPPPKGFTGKDGESPSAEQKTQWAREEPDGNTAQRLPEDCIGIDVDHYGAKRGGDTLAEAEKRWGPLPPTDVSTSRPDGVSGIRVYRKPEGVKLNGNITFPDLGLGDIEIIQYHHRYLVCYPSIHPDTGNTYRWYEPGYSAEHMVEADGPPCLGAVAELPEAWLEALREDAKTKSKAKPRVVEDTAYAEIPYIIEDTAYAEVPYIIERALSEGQMSPRVAKRLAEATAHCCSGCRHDQILGDTLALLRMGSQGEPGVFEAMSTLAETFVRAVADDRKGGQDEAADEFMRMLSNEGAARLLSEPDEYEKDEGGPPEGDKSTYIDVAALLSGELPEAPAPALLSRTDGKRLFYKGEVNIVLAIPSTGKPGSCSPRASRSWGEVGVF